MKINPPAVSAGSNANQPSAKQVEIAAGMIMAGMVVQSEIDAPVVAFSQPIRTERRGIENAMMTYAHQILGTGGQASLAAEDLGDVGEFINSQADEVDEDSAAAWEQLHNLMLTLDHPRALRIGKDSNGDGEVDLTARKVAYVIAGRSADGASIVGVSFLADES